MTFGKLSEIWPPEIWLVTGIPGAGKTSVARALAERLDRSAVVEGDSLRAWVVRGAAWPEDGALTGEAERQYELAVRNMCLLARSYAEGGFTPFLDLVVVTRYHLEAFRGYLRGARLRLVVLAPSVEVTLGRDRARGGKAGDGWTHSPAEDPRHRGDTAMREELAGFGLWVDSSALSVEATADAILERQAEALLPPL